MTAVQYYKARLLLAFRALTADPDAPPTSAECMLYEACFVYQQTQEKNK